MANYIEIEQFIKLKKEFDDSIAIIDVRSFSEYNHAHIPNAFNVALFDDKERERVGVVYKEQGHKEAVLEGLNFASHKMISITKEIASIVEKTHTNKVIIHCARGGMRSQSVSMLTDVYGIETFVIIGGYKAYRNYVLNSFKKKYNIVMLCAKTGCAKTGILKNIKSHGLQVIDLEGLAHHKGSAFGAIGELAQPTQEQFENNLSKELDAIDIKKELWLEDESLLIGRIAIPKDLFNQMKTPKKAIYINIPKEERAKYIVSTYGLYDKNSLAEAIKKIEKRLSNEVMRECLKLLDENKIYECVLLLLNYYDKAYRSNPDKNLAERIIEIESENTDIEKNAKLCMEKI